MSTVTQSALEGAFGANASQIPGAVAATAGTVLPPLVEGVGHWRGSGRYERGDRRDRSLTHWSYGDKVDQARIRRVLAMLDAGWTGRRSRAYDTAARILTEIARCWDSTARISRICKASIALRLDLHRNTVYRYCKLMERAGILIQGLYDAPKGQTYKSYAVWAIAGMTGRLPLLLSFRRRHSRHARLADIRWPMKALAAWGRRACALLPDTPRTDPKTDPQSVAQNGGKASDTLSKNPEIVHNTCNRDLYLSQTVRNAPDRRSDAGAPDARGDSGTAPLSGTRQRSSAAAVRGGGLRRLGSVLSAEPSGGEEDGLEGKAPEILLSCPDTAVPAVERVRSRLAAYEQGLGHLASYRPPAGFPRGWMRRRLAAIDDAEWDRLIGLALRLPMVNGTEAMRDGRMFGLNLWWLIRHAPRLLALSEPERRVDTPKRPPADHSPARRMSARERTRRLAEMRTRNPELADALERLGRNIEDDGE